MATMVDSYTFPLPIVPSTFIQPFSHCDEEMQSSMVDLTRQLSEHTLAQCSSQGELSSYPFARRWSFEQSPTPSNATISSTSSTTEPPSCTSLASTHFSPVSDCSYSDYSASCIRRQRQRALRSQCSTSHLQAISALVSRMMENGEQCNVRSVSPEDKDIVHIEAEGKGTPQAKGINDMEEDDERRPSIIHNHSTDRRSERRSCIAKDVRSRKHIPRTLNTTASGKR